jgi:hypothetical protein
MMQLKQADAMRHHRHSDVSGWDLTSTELKTQFLGEFIIICQIKFTVGIVCFTNLSIVAPEATQWILYRPIKDLSGNTSSMCTVHNSISALGLLRSVEHRFSGGTTQELES